ncbi:UNVERIFIED_ORG: DNA-binding transcriptional LysR family regulator [Lelliottia amnigena]|nr:DNA-binding transcriptional LysR family regulator [Lelliottia amnigena]
MRAIFPDPLFIRKGQGVTPTAYATHLHEYISQGLESILGALDLTGSYDKQRTITIGTSPSVGAMVLPIIYQAVKREAPQLMLRNIPVNDTETQLAQFQTDLIIDSNAFGARSLAHSVLYADGLLLVCRKNHPALSQTATAENLREYEYALFMNDGHNLNQLHQRVNELFPDRLVNFSSYNMFTIAALVGNSDMITIMPSRLYTLLRQCWPLEQIPYAPLNAESIEIALHYNKLSLRDPVLENVINIIRQAF